MHIARLALLLIASAPAAAAQSPTVTLSPASATLPHEFTDIGSVRELGDGRVLITDAREHTVLIADLRSGETRSIGAHGAGPNEYRDLGPLITLGADTTLMADMSNRRMLLLHRDRIIATLAPDHALVAAAGTRLLGADAAGRLFGSHVIVPADFNAPRRRNGIAVVAVHRGTLRADTLVTIRDAELQTRAVGAPEARTVQTMSVLLSSPEQAAVFPDGAVAVALQEPYRVEWHSPDGTVKRGAAIERTAPPLNEAEKQAWKQRAEAASGGPLPFPLDRVPWAEFVPPFRAGGLTTLPDGDLLVAREPWSGSNGVEYDIIDRRGTRTGTVRLRAGERVVGSGSRDLYVAVTDDDGIERLRRHPWPGRGAR